MNIDRFRHLIAITGEGRQPVIVRAGNRTFEIVSVQLVYDQINGVSMWHVVAGERVRVTGDAER